MKSFTIVIATFTLIGFNTSALSAFWQIGIDKSCATWLAGTNNITDGMWILGFWTGLNYSEDSMAGKTTDAPGLLAEVKKVCEEEPSLSVANATASVHRRFKEYGK